MGIKERRHREIELLKKNILSAARKIATEKGWPSVSIRKIAEIIEYTPPVIYEHYKNKEAILAALEEMGFQELQQLLNAAKEQHNEAKNALLAISSVYWEFALSHADLYQVMFNLEGIRSTPPDTQALRVSAQAVIDTLKPLHTFPSERESLFFQWWAIVHGFVSLAMSGQLPGMKDQLHSYLMEGIERFINSMV